MSEMISLGGRQFELRPMKLGQLRHVLDALETMQGKSGGGLITAATQLVAAGLAAAHPRLSADDLLDLEAGIDELNAAVSTILRHAGLNPPGETAPVASPAASSAPSTAPSPPAAAIPIVSSTA